MAARRQESRLKEIGLDERGTLTPDAWPTPGAKRAYSWQSAADAQG